MTTSHSRVIGSARVSLVSHIMNEIRNKIAGKSVYVFLDYDGTLTPIVPDPSNAVLSQEMYEVVMEVSQICSVGVVTGRGRGTIKSFIKDELADRVSIAASHGFDISLPTGEYIQVGDSDHMSEFKRFKSYLSTCEFPTGCMIEDTGYSISVHYRHVDPHMQASIKPKLQDCLRLFSGLVLTSGKMVYEVRLDLDWNKGRAVDWILQHTFLKTHSVEDICVIYIGDDITDEDGFKALYQYTNNCSIIVADKLTRPTNASFRLRDPDDVMKFLTQLVNTIKAK